MAVFAANTNETIISYAIETAPGEVDAGATWTVTEPNDIGDFASNISTVARDPISNDRAPRKGAITDLDATVSFDSDLTVASFRDFFDGFAFAVWKEQNKAEPTAVATADDSYTHATITTALTAGTLIFARDFSLSANNGVKRVAAASTTLKTLVEENLSDETPPTGARFNVAGFQGASGDIQVDTEGNLISGGTYDFTDDITDGRPTFYVGQYIYVGDSTNAAYSFATAGFSGFARITAIAAAKLTLDNYSDEWTDAIGSADTGTGKTIRVYTGDWIRTVEVSNADFLNRTYQFEAEYNNLSDPTTGNPVDGWEYINGCSPNQVTLNTALTDKATVNWGFIGLDSEAMVYTAKTKGGYKEPTDTDAYNTTNDFARIYLKDLDNNDVGVYFKNMDLTINNNITPEKILGQLGSVVNSVGTLNVSASTEALFTSGRITDIVRANTTVKMNWVLDNDDGALCFDLPAITLGSANKSFPRNETIKVTLDIEAFKDNALDYVFSVTDFPHLPE